MRHIRGVVIALAEHRAMHTHSSDEKDQGA